MDSLDKKLTKILFDFKEGKYNENGIDIASRKIEKAFRNAGYIHRSVLTEESLNQGFENVRLESQRIQEDLRRVNILSGKEWYDRFEKELIGNIAWLTSSHDTIKQKVLDTARKASGIE